MATEPSTKGHSPCPFCNTVFRRVGNHLPHCKQRDGKDYSQYLAPKTLKNKSQSRKKAKCPKCDKYFVRLDTHLRNSALCRAIPSPPSHPVQSNTMACTEPSHTYLSVPLGEEAMFQNSNFAAPALVGVNETTIIPVASPKVKPHLILPKTIEGWQEANKYFERSLAPAVMLATNPHEKHSVLIEGIYSYFASVCGTKVIKVHKSKKRPLHNVSLKEVERKKKMAKQELRQARQQGFPAEAIQSLAHQFLSLVRSHSRLKRSSNARQKTRDVRTAREQCHTNFGRYAKEVLDGGPSSHVTPAFGEEKAFKFFSEVYHSGIRNYVQPLWMPSPPAPSVEMNCSLFTATDIMRVIKKLKSCSAPSPFDRVGYVIFKKCPALIPILVHLFNTCWTNSVIPDQWKIAAIKLIPKGSAVDDATNPGNFRPIALTPCIGKIFSTLLRNRWLQYMLLNNYLDPSLQKAFMPTVPGCTEHHLKLSSILSEAQSKHKALAICWLDLANAYGSVHHSLIQFSLRHYQAPPQFLSILQSLYSGLNAKVITPDWETPLVSLEKGVYQGDPLSVVIFNTVMNTLVDTITSRINLGYQFSGSSRKVNILQYADDTCLVANSPASCQALLNEVSQWLQWSGMAPKVPKCQCISLQGSTGKLKDPQLQLDGGSIPFTTNPIRFLGLNLQASSHYTSPRPDIVSKLQVLLRAVNDTPLTRRQKLLMYSAGVCPRLTWPLLIQEFPITWVEKELDSITTRYLKHWAGLSKSANTAILYLPRSMGGLNLPLLSTLHKKLQVSRQCQLMTSRDGCVRFLADRTLRSEVRLSRKKFRPAAAARDILAASPGGSRKALVRAAKTIVAEDTNISLLEHMQSLERQGHMSRCTDLKVAPVWASVVQSLPEEQMKFSLNAAVDVLPHNANLHLWRKRNDPACPLCNKNQSLLHVLNNCMVARDLRRYNVRHDGVLKEIAAAIKPYLSPTSSLSIDIQGTYEFPLHIVSTDLRPDIVWWDTSNRSMCLAELTVCFESNFEDAEIRKTAKYTDLIDQATNNGYNTTLLALQVGSRGIPHYRSFSKLASVLHMSTRDFTNLLQRVAKAAISGSFTIWCSRNRRL